ncbi:MAG: amino acid-binding protein [Proteobacteria bacterium]|nr:amino acid-binding protein [Pseudomonadota bacterium]
MKLKQIAVNIENSPGRFFEVIQILGNAGINLRAHNLVDTGECGILRLIVSDLAKARRILMEKQLPAIVENVVAAEIEDKPGQLAALLEPLQNAKVRVIYMYTYIGFCSGKTVMIFRFSDNDKAIEVLQENGIKLIDAKALGIDTT